MEDHGKCMEKRNGAKLTWIYSLEVAITKTKSYEYIFPPTVYSGFHFCQYFGLLIMDMRLKGQHSSGLFHSSMV